ncbi:MAG: hypothetical protein EA403_06820 [Spirochaetaceae bacterium]|nr:MAG: hypothetical protein EA403_06820 [Spirochaetaceae bacterium]
MADKNARLAAMFREDAEGMIELLHLIAARIGRTENPLESIDQAFRYAHSIRSEASFLRYGSIVAAAREVERILRRCREAGRATASDSQGLSDAVVALDHALSGVEPALASDGPGGGRILLADETHLLDSPLDAVRLERLRASRVRGEQLFLVRCRVDEIPEMVAPRLYLVIGNLEKAANVIDTLPRLDGLVDGVDRIEVLCALTGGPEELRRAVAVDAVEQVEIESLEYSELDPIDPTEYRSGMMVQADRITLSMETRRYEQLCLHADELTHQLAEIVERDRSALQSLSRESRLRFELTERLADSVAATIRATSYVSARTILDPLPAVVRRIARDAGKQVRVRITAADVSLFLPVADIVRDILLHLVRNAVDHGIEPPAQRTAAGKPETGVIEISVESQHPDTVLRIHDDGRGIPAQARGSGRSLWEVISAAGFTTAGADTGASGEGVGLDVVRYSVERVLSGSVELESEAGRGCRFAIRVPTVGRPLSVLVAKSASRFVAIPAAYVFDRFVIDMAQVTRDSAGALHYRYGDEAVPLRSLEAEGVKATEGVPLHGLLLAVGANRQLVVVNDVVGEETVLRDVQVRDSVFSQSVNQSVSLFLPLRYL